MKNKLFVLTFLLAALLLVGCATTQEASFETGSGTLPLKILHVNDLHGHIEQDDRGREGISNMSYLINEIRDESELDHVILIGNGDMFQGTSISNMTYGLAVLESMNAMRFDALGIGNHEFDWGIETILAYFDNDETNGEADFPLLNANIYSVEDDSLLTVENGNVLESVVIEREDIKVGIISYIGDVYGSISYDRVQDYYFDLAITNSIEDIAGSLRSTGVDVIVVNIHGMNHALNSDIALLVDEEGDYLVDALLTGHTHSKHTSDISRLNGVAMPVMQAGANGRSFGEITLTVDLETKRVVDTASRIIDVSTAGRNYDPEVEAIIDGFKEKLGNQILVKSGETITNRSQFYDWTANVMAAATGADVAIHNTGGIRSTGNIRTGDDITLKQMYEISPFDNTVWLIEMTYDELKPLLDNNSLFHTVSDGVELGSQGTYTVAIISYVYYNYDQLDGLRSNEDINTNLYIRDLLVEDLMLKEDKGELFAPTSNPSASIGLLYER